MTKLAELETLKAENERLRAKIERLEQAEQAPNEWQSFTATAYTADCAEGCTGIAATGIDVRNTTHYKGKRVIATDPAVIPLGSTVEIRFRDGRVERAIAADKGGAIRGNIIDYLISDYRSAIQFGRQRVEIRIINEGKR